MIVQTVRVTGVETSVKGIAKWTRVGEITSEGLMRWGRILERDMKMSLIQAGVRPFTGRLLTTGIRWEQAPKGRIGRLFIRQYGVALDSMDNHFVNITRSRGALLSWALHARSSAIRAAAERVASGKTKAAAIYVRRHPYIKNGLNRARPKLNPILRQEMNRLRRSRQ